MKKFLTAIITLIPLNSTKIFLLNILGHKVSYKSKIGINLFFIDKFSLDSEASIGHFNYIKITELHLEEKAFIKNLNYFKGPFTISLHHSSGISNKNKIRRAYKPITYGKASLIINENSYIVSNHFIDLTCSISIGKNSIIAGIGSQMWTHGYYHTNIGKDRVRIDGQIHIGDNVYVGSSCIFNPGVKVANAIHIGGGSVISKNLDKSGMYVRQPLRHINNDIDNVKSRLKKLNPSIECVDVVYTKDVSND